jgi:hypothetical protein
MLWGREIPRNKDSAAASIHVRPQEVGGFFVLLYSSFHFIHRGLS